MSKRPGKNARPLRSCKKLNFGGFLPETWRKAGVVSLVGNDFRLWTLNSAILMYLFEITRSRLIRITGQLLLS